jgi:hypothetical protein
MPRADSLAGLERATGEFEVSDLGLVIEPEAEETARRSLEESGLLLLGEVHGVAENPLLIRALMQAFGLTSVALEWPEELTPVIGSLAAGGALADHPLLWLGDGRITAGHLAVLRERATAGPLALCLFDGTLGAGWNWSRRDEAMAGQILAAAGHARTLVVAGNAHTPTAPTNLGIPLGARLSWQRPGVRDIRVSYGSGRFYSMKPRQFPGTDGGDGRVHLREQQGELILELPAAAEAVVPQRRLAMLRTLLVQTMKRALPAPPAAAVTERPPVPARRSEQNRNRERKWTQWWSGWTHAKGCRRTVGPWQRQRQAVTRPTPRRSQTMMSPGRTSGW